MNRAESSAGLPDCFVAPLRVASSICHFSVSYSCVSFFMYVLRELNIGKNNVDIFFFNLILSL